MAGLAPVRLLGCGHVPSAERSESESTNGCLARSSSASAAGAGLKDTEKPRYQWRATSGTGASSRTTRVSDPARMKERIRMETDSETQAASPGSLDPAGSAFRNEFGTPSHPHVVEIIRLREWIREEGKRTDTCTYNILREICEGCRCHRAQKTKVGAVARCPRCGEAWEQDSKQFGCWKCGKVDAPNS